MYGYKNSPDNKKLDFIKQLKLFTDLMLKLVIILFVDIFQDQSPFFCISFISQAGLSQQLRNRAKERDRSERRRSSGNNLPSGMVPRVVRRNDRGGSDRTSSEIENCKLCNPYIGVSLIS